VYRQPSDTVKARKLHDFLRWAMTEGGADAAALDYGPLPQQMSQQIIARLDSISPAR
jgi:phosphate transport system substrate-binding protein